MDKAERLRKYQQFGRRLEERGYAPQQEDDQWRSEGALGDTAVGLAAGALDIPSAVTGLADVGTALGPGALARAADNVFGDGEPGAIRQLLDRPFSRAASAVGEATGFQPSQWADTLREERYSPQMEAQQQNVEQEWQDVGEAYDQGDWSAVGRETLGAAGAMLRNPRTIQSLVTESLPATVAGGLLGRAVSAAGGATTSLAGRPIQGALTPLAGASQASGRAVATGQAASRMAGVTAAQTVARQTPRIGPVGGAAVGEGALISGMVMDDIDDEVDPQRAALAALGAGVGGAALGYGGGRLAQRAGLVDPDVAIAGGGFRGAEGGRRGLAGLATRTAGGAVAEGVLQEMPQESLETITQNWAEGEPLLKGVPRAAVSGLLAGGVMGAGANIAPPRRAQEPTDLLTTPATQEPVDANPEGFRGPMNPQGRDLQTLKRYYRRLRRVAEEATDHPDLQEEAAQRMTGVMQELDNLGYPREVVDLELAKDRYTELSMERDQMQRKYREALRTQPENAPRYLERVRARNTEIARLEEAYGPDELRGPDVETLQALQQDPDAAPLFRQRRGEPTNKLKRRAQQKLTELREMPDEQLAYEIARDEFNAQTNPESPELKYRPLRRAVSRERNLDDSLLREVYNREFTQEGQQAERERRQLEEQGDPLARFTRMADVDAAAQQGELDQATIEQVTGEAPVEEPAAEPQQVDRQAELTRVLSNLPTAEDAVWRGMLQAAEEVDGTSSIENVAERVGEITGKSKDNVKGTFNRLRKRIERELGVEQSSGLTSAQFMNMLVQSQSPTMAAVPTPTQAIEQAEASVDPVDTDLTDTAPPQDQQLEWDDETEAGSRGQVGELIGGGGGTTMSIGGSQSQVSDAPDRATSRQARQAYEAFSEVEQGAPVSDRQAELDAIAEENRQLAAQRQQELRQQARSYANTPIGEAAGRMWDKRANPNNPKAVAIWPNGVQPFSWSDLVESDPLTAMAWIETTVELSGSVAASEMAPALRRAFIEFNRDIQNGQAQQAPTEEPSVLGSAGAEAEPTGPESGGTAEETAGATDAADGESGPVTDDVQIKADGTPFGSERGVRASKRFRETPNAVPVEYEPGKWGYRVQEEQDAETEDATDRQVQDAQAVQGRDGQTVRERTSQEGAEETGTGIVTTSDGLLADENGDPLTVYHGTGGRTGGVGQFMRVSELDPALLGSNTGAASAREGFFFSSSMENAGFYASRGQARDLVDAFRIVRNVDREEAVRNAAGAPLRPASQAIRSQAQQMIDAAVEEGRIMSVNLRMRNPLVHDYAGADWTTISDTQSAEHPSLTELITQAKRNGNDGVIMRNINDPLPGDNYVVFGAGQIVQEGESTSGEVMPSTRASSGQGPIVRTRGRRGRRQGAQQLQQGQAADADAIQAAIDAGAENPGPETSARIALAISQSSQRRTQAAMDAPDVDVQADSITEFLDYQDTGNADVNGVLDMVDAIIGQDHPLYELSQALRVHASTQNVRFMADQPVDMPTAMGYYLHQMHAININPDYWTDIASDLAVGARSASERQDLQLAETILHELVHAASVRAMRQQGSDFHARMREVYLQVRQYMQDNPNEFFADERGAIQYMFSDEFEFMTMAMTSPEAQRVLKAVPASDSYNGTMFGRVVQAILDFFGLTNTPPSALEEALSIVTDVMDLDASTTQKFIANTQANNTLMISDMKKPFDNLRLLSEVNMEGADAFTEELVARMEAVSDAEMSGDAEAKAVALEGLRRVAEGIEELVAQVQAPSERSLLTASNRPAPDTLSDRIYDAALNKAPGATKNMLSDLKNRIKGLTYLSSFSHDFVDMVKKFLPQAETYFTTVFNRLSERNNQHVEIQRIVDPVGELTNRQRDALNTVLREMTYQEAWAFQPDWVPTQVQVDPAMKRKFDALPTVAQKAAIDMFRYAYESNRDIQRMLRADIIATYDAYIEKAKTDKETDKRIDEKAQALAEHDQRQIDPSTPYLPLKRWGEWAVVHKSARFKQAEARKNRREINQLKQDPAHYRVVFAETEFQARQERDAMAEELGVEVEPPFQRMRYEESNEMIPFDLMTRLREEAIGKTDVGSMTEVERRVAAAVDRMYIAALEESSVRKSELQRLKVEGAGRDMVRSFIEHGQGLAALSSAIKINKETRKVIAQMKKHATDPKAGKERNDRMMALNEVLARHATSIDADFRDNWQQRVMGYTSIWMLLTSPAYYLQNSTQPFMLTYPVLASRFGANKSMAYMRHAYKAVIGARRATKADGTEGLMDPAKLTDPREQMLFTRLQRLGLLDVGIAADLGSLRQGKGPIGKTFYAAHHKMLTAVRWVEVYNRGVTAISSFRLQKDALTRARDAGRNQLSDSAIDEQAMQYAVKIVQTTQGDYSGPNAPRLIDKLPAGRLLTQFRKFQLIQIGLLTRTIHQMFAKQAPGQSRNDWLAERAIGRRQAAYILSMHAMVGGALGLPAANIIGYALAKAFGDDDEPANAELLARRAIGDKDVADLVLRGLPARLGVDMSQRLGMGLTFSIMPFADISASRDGFYTMVGNLLGPTVGLGAMFMDGAGQIQQGNVAMGMTQFMPSLLKNAMRAYLYKTDGVRMRNGDTALSAEELSWFSTATQGIGWPGKQITDRYFATGALIDVDQHFRSRTTKIKRAYTEAWEAGDREGMDEARDAWRSLQDMRREYGLGNPQSLSVLIKAPMERQERERLMVRGVAARRTQQRFVESLFE